VNFNLEFQRLKQTVNFMTRTPNDDVDSEDFEDGFDLEDFYED
jgi:hypothetical protein